MSMGTWRRRQLEKKGRASQTPGSKKGMRPTPLQRVMCARNRSWKHPDYDRVMSSLGTKKVAKG